MIGLLLEFQPAEETITRLAKQIEIGRGILFNH
jgi:hypothetical protein